MRRIGDILEERRASGEKTLSFELFPPKTDAGVERLMKTVAELAELGPDFFSVTYGAGGSTSRRTLEVAREAQRVSGVPAMHHLTLVGETRGGLARNVSAILDAGLRNVLALRGDPPPEMGDRFRKVPGGLEYAWELVELVREIAGDSVSVGVAGFPERHVDCPSDDLDTQYLKMKLDHGADFVVTQLFFENERYSAYLERTARAGVAAPILPGVLPITDYAKLLTFCERCGTRVPERVHERFGPLARDAGATLAGGTDFAVGQSTDLLARGAPGLHFYTLDRAEPTRAIVRRLGLGRRAPGRGA